MERLGNRASQTRDRRTHDSVRDCKPGSEWQTQHRVPVHCEWCISVELPGDLRGVGRSAGVHRECVKECHVFTIAKRGVWQPS